MGPIFHIGYPKTATRWLQESLFPCIREAKIVCKEDIYEHIIKPDSLSFNQETASNHFKIPENETVIFSTHELIGTNYHFGFNGYLIKENAIRIKQLYPDARIVLLIRNQADIITSAYLQYIMEGGTYSLNKYLYNRRLSSMSSFSLFSYAFYEYHKTIHLYHQLFGKSQVYVFLYEELKENPELFVRKFAETLHLTVETDKIDFTIVNPSLRKHVKLIAQVLNHFTEKKMINKRYYFHVPWLYEYIQRLLNRINRYRIFGGFLNAEEVLKPKRRSELDNYYSRSNQILVSEYGIDLKKYNYTLPDQS